MNNLCNARKVHRPPIKVYLVKNPCASNPQSNNNECPIQFDGVDVDTVKKLQPSKYYDAKLCVNYDVTKLVPVNHEPTDK